MNVKESAKAVRGRPLIILRKSSKELTLQAPVIGDQSSWIKLLPHKDLIDGEPNVRGLVSATVKAEPTDESDQGHVRSNETKPIFFVTVKDEASDRSDQPSDASDQGRVRSNQRALAATVKDEPSDGSDRGQAVQDVLRLNATGDLTVEWSYGDRELPGVILHDKLMTDAVLGTRPIKTEHSYSLASDGDSLPESPISHNKVDVDDMDEECFPAISMHTSCTRLSDNIDIKDEPCSDPDSPISSCPPSPQSSFMNTSDIHIDVEMDDTELSQDTVIKQANIILSSPHTILPQRIQVPKVLTGIKIENGSSNTFQLPPTPSSCSSSEDSEDNTVISRPASPGNRKLHAARVIMNHTSTRQPIHTPLISSQPKGSTGSLILTDEEKRTLLAEGYPVPTRLPLTKAEEKSLKKIRRKIKNKISAQESRRKKKEYMDMLERKVEILVSENSDYRKKIQSLEDSNSNLSTQLQRLQTLLSRTHPQFAKQIK